jgi:putative ABC transport system permease protein
MIKNYFLMAWRIMRKNKAYTTINILGFSFGIATALLIGIYISDELNYDSFYKEADILYRVNVKGEMNGNTFNLATSPNPLAQTLVDQVPEVVDALRFGLFKSMPIQLDENSFAESKTLVSDPNFLDFFGLELKSGDPATALVGPNKIIITEALASKYFGKENPLEKTILRGPERIETQITGVIYDFPQNSHLAFDAILSGDSWDYFQNEQWTSNNIYTYFKTFPNASITNVQSALDRFVIQYFGEEVERYLGISMQAFLDQGNNAGYKIMPIKDIHLHSDLQEEIKPTGNIQYLYIFGVVAIFIIVLACINFMNLSTAKSANRAKEVGVRKTIGAKTSKLILQFLSESVLYSAISTLLACILVIISLRYFNSLTSKSLDLSVFVDLRVIAALVIFALLIGIVAGSYPAFYLTSFSPVNVLKGKVVSGLKNSGLRNGLVVFQFFVSITLIIGTMVVYQQLNFLQEKNLGFDKENVLTLNHTYSLGPNAQSFKDELLAQSAIQSASFANMLPPHVSFNSVFRRTDNGQDFLCNIYLVDHDHVATMGYKLIDGRFFSQDFISDSTAVIVNETAFKLMGWTDLDGSQKISGFWGNNSEPVEKRVIGVFKDFNFESLRNSVNPLVVSLGPIPNNMMAIKLNPGNVRESIALIEGIWKKHADGTVFEYSFIDSNFDALFRSEQKMGNIMLTFTVLAIIIACLGLFGLASFTTEQRSKEISIRKTLGASLFNLVGLLSKDFTLLVLISFLVAAPVAYIVMNKFWLVDFPYRIDISLMLIILAGFLSICISWLTVSYQSFKAASSNPIKFLKNE